MRQSVAGHTLVGKRGPCIRATKREDGSMRIARIEDLALRRRLAGHFVPQDHHRRGHRRLVGIHGGLRRAGADRRHPQARRAADRPGPARRSSASPRISTRATRQAPGGVNQQAIAAIENALVDIKAKALGRAGLRDARRPGARPAAALLVALRHLPRAPCRPDRNGPGSSRCARSTTSSRSARRSARRASRALKTNLIRFDRRAGPTCTAPAPATRRASRAQRRHAHRRCRVDAAGGVPRRRRPRCRAPSRHQLQLQDRRLHQARAGAGAARPGRGSRSTSTTRRRSR